MLPTNLIFEDHPDIFEVIGVEMKEELATISISSKQSKCFCPCCGVNSCQLHSYYFRTVKDLPAFGNSVILRLRSRKFYCNNNTCERKVFTERFNHYLTSYHRLSERLRQKALKVALLAGGNTGARLCKTLNIPISSSGLIRLIHQQELPPLVTSHALGIDDWAYKKGNTYGTAIVDLVQHKIIDLLPDREASTVETWLKVRPETKIITRDRFARYAKGVTKALPLVTQVADRWHLLKNMGDALQKMLERKRQELKPQINKKKKSCDVVLGKDKPKGEKSDKEPMTKRQKQLKQIKELNAQGISIRAISRVLKISRNTVRKYIYLDEPPRKCSSRSNILMYTEYLQSRINDFPTIEVMQLWKEIKGKGYSGCRTTVYEYLKNYSKAKKENEVSLLPQIESWLPRKVSLLLYRKEELLSLKEKKLINSLKKRSGDIRMAAQLSNKFRQMMEDKQGHLLKGWVNEVVQSPLKELKSFAKGLLTDFAAVENAFTLPWSNGQVEGQINKLKTVKRQMYGKASFELLRKRMVLGYG